MFFIQSINKFKYAKVLQQLYIKLAVKNIFCLQHEADALKLLQVTRIKNH